MKNIAAIFIIFSSTILHKCLGYSHGAPISQCDRMMPGHGPLAQEGPSPYRIKVEKPYYMPGKNVKLSVESSSDSVKGFLIQARKVGENKALATGKFVNLPRSSKYVSCGNKQGAVTHATKLTVKTMNFEWEPALDLTGNISFFATVVKDKATFWIQLQSPELYKKERKEIPVILKFSSSSTSLSPIIEPKPSTSVYVKMDKSIESNKYISSSTASSPIVQLMTTLSDTTSAYGKVKKGMENIEQTSFSTTSSVIKSSMPVITFDTSPMLARASKSFSDIKTLSSPTATNPILPKTTTLLDSISMHVEVSKSIEKVELTSSPTKHSQITPSTPMRSLPDDSTTVFVRASTSTSDMKSHSSPTESSLITSMITTLVNSKSAFVKLSNSQEQIEPTSSPAASSRIIPRKPMMTTLTNTATVHAKASKDVKDMKPTSTANMTAMMSTPFTAMTTKPTTGGHTTFTPNIFTSLVSIMFLIVCLH